MEDPARGGARPGLCDVFVRSSSALGPQTEGRNQVQDDARSVAARTRAYRDRPFNLIFAHESIRESFAGSVERITVLAFAITEEHSQGRVGIPSISVPG